MSTYFTSDQHFGHANILSYCNRPFSDVDEMNEALIDNWNSTVAPDDTVYVLGDLALGSLSASLARTAELHGTKRLVPGNHDRPWEGHKKPSHHAAYEAAGFDILPSQVTLDLGVEVLLCHFPYVGDSHDTDRYTSMRPIDVGGWLLHGHVHDSWKKRDRMINVGVDVWDFTPVHADELITLMQ